MMSVEPKASKPSRGGRIVKWMLAIIGVLLVGAAILLGPDQLRDVPEIDPNAPLRMTMAGGGNKSDKSDLSDLSDSSDASTARARAAAAFAEQARPVPDVEALPEQLRPLAEAWNRLSDQSIAELLDMIARPEARTLQETLDRTTILVMDYWKAETKFVSEGHAMGPEVKRLVEADHPARFAAFRAFYVLQSKAQLAAYIHNKNWIGAGACCQIIGGYETGDEREYWWDLEVAHKRKAGIEGRVDLLGRSIQRAYGRWAVKHPETDAVLRDWDMTP